jgi:hypothetical protein
MKAKPHVCPNCNGLGSVFFESASRRVQAACGHSKCQGALEERLFERLSGFVQRWAAVRDGLDVADLLLQSQEGLKRVFAELFRHLPQGVTKGAKR